MFSEKLSNVPEGTAGKSDLQTRLDGISAVTSPEVNDKDGNGVLDTVQLTDADQAIEAAEEAKRAVDNKLTEITSDGLINPSEKAELDVLIETLDKAKTNATEKLNNVPDGTIGKVDLQTRLDGIGTVTSPEVNDKDSNGILDTVQLTDADQAIEAVEEAKRAVDNKLTEITSDGLVDALPDVLKGDLPTRLNNLTGIQVPEVNDADGNGIVDDKDRAQAESKVTEAEAADQVAKTKLSEYQEDGLITEPEKVALENLATTAQSKKTEAQGLVDALPDGLKNDLVTRLNNLTGIQVPAVNDADGNGIADNVDQAKARAENKVTEAEAADQAAKTKLTEYQQDGLITASEKADLEHYLQAQDGIRDMQFYFQINSNVMKLN